MDSLDKFIKQVTGLVKETGLQPAVLILVGKGGEMSTIFPHNLPGEAAQSLLQASLHSFSDPTAKQSEGTYITEGGKA